MFGLEAEWWKWLSNGRGFESIRANKIHNNNEHRRIKHSMYGYYLIQLRRYVIEKYTPDILLSERRRLAQLERYMRSW